MLFWEYFCALFFIFFSISLASLLFSLSFFLIRRNFDIEKYSPYECGFDPFGDSRGRFDVRFYLVAILFIIFDLEVVFLFPWSLTLYNTGFIGFWAMTFFLFLLTLGFIYEWQKGALEW